MADRLYASYWLHGFTAMNMLRHYEKMMAAFPFSKLAKSESILRVHGVSYREPTVFEAAFPPPLDVEAVLTAARDFHNADGAYELSTTWDLWHWDGDWKLLPAPVILSCHGPEFESENGANLEIEFGLEEQFLPTTDRPGGLKMIRSNIQSLLRLMHDMDQVLQVERRQLWSESGENFAERLEIALHGVQ
jgi:hypothetical protein